MSSPQWEKLIYIAGSGRCGSTLLSMILNNHPDIISLSELNLLKDFISSDDANCSCDSSMKTCRFWNEVNQELSRIEGGTSKNWLKEHEYTLFRPSKLPAFFSPEKISLIIGNPILHKILLKTFYRNRYVAVENLEKVFEALSKTSHCSVIADSSKNAPRLKTLYMSFPEKMKIIFLVRDGRAVAASFLRKRQEFQNLDFKNYINIWKQTNRKIMLAIRSIPKQDVFILKYEDFCETPDEILERICSFSGIDFSPEILNFKKEKFHGISGSSTRSAQKQITVNVDQKWKTELSDEQLLLFQKIGGKLNHFFGYE